MSKEVANKGPVASKQAAGTEMPECEITKFVRVEFAIFQNSNRIAIAPLHPMAKLFPCSEEDRWTQTS